MVLDIASAGAKCKHPRVVASARYLWQMHPFFHPSKSYHLRLNGIISESRMAVAMKEDLSDEYPENKVISQDEICDFDVGRLSPYARLRMIVDFVASMTDKYSVELYQTLSGNSS